MSDRSGEDGRGLEPLAALGAAIQTLRAQAGLSQEELAVRCDLDLPSLAAIEGGRKEPTWGDLRRIASGVGTALDQLLALAEELEQGHS